MISEIGTSTAVNPQPPNPTSPQVLGAAQGFKAQSIEMSIESMMFNAERAMSNEAMQRSLSKVFGKFSLIQKIMQTLQ